MGQVHKGTCPYDLPPPCAFCEAESRRVPFTLTFLCCQGLKRAGKEGKKANKQKDTSTPQPGYGKEMQEHAVLGASQLSGALPHWIAF